MQLGAEIAQWLARRTRGRKVAGSSPGRVAGFKKKKKKKKSLQGQLYVLKFYFGIRSTPVLPQQQVQDPGHSAKSAGGRLQLNTHAPYVCGFA